MSWFYSNMFVYQSIILNLFLYIFHDFMGFYFSQNAKFSFPINPWPGFCRSTESVDRRAQTCTPVLAGGRPTETVDRPESTALWKGPGRPTGQRDLLSVSWPRSAAGRPMAQRSEIWPLCHRSAARTTRAFSESRALWTVDRLGRPALQPDWRARLCTSVNRVGRLTPNSVDRSGRPAEARTGI